MSEQDNFSNIITLNEQKQQKGVCLILTWTAPLTHYSSSSAPFLEILILRNECQASSTTMGTN